MRKKICAPREAQLSVALVCHQVVLVAPGVPVEVPASQEAVAHQEAVVLLEAGKQRFEDNAWQRV